VICFERSYGIKALILTFYDVKLVSASIISKHLIWLCPDRNYEQ